MKKTVSLIVAQLLLTAGWMGAFLLGNNPNTNQNLWLIPALTIGAGIGLCLRFVSGRKTALLLVVTAVAGLATGNIVFPQRCISFNALRTLFSGSEAQSKRHQLQVDARLRVSPFNQPLTLISPLTLDLSLYSRLPAGVSDFCFSPNGDLYVSLPSLGAIYHLDHSAGGALPGQKLFIHNLDNPTGLICTATDLFVAESTDIRTYSYRGGSSKLLIDQLPEDGGHLDHKLLKTPQGIFFSIGSRCDACTEKNSLRATLQLLDQQGRRRRYARGLRHVGGLVYNAANGSLWASERSFVFPEPGANDELNSVQKGADYGWPSCNGAKSDAALSVRCQDKKYADLLLRGRSNPAGLLLTSHLNYPAVYRNSLLLVLQGDPSNRIVPAVVRIPLVEGKAGPLLAFLGGWDGVRMRPSAIHAGPDGAVYIADELSGAIYRAAWQGEN